MKCPYCGEEFYFNKDELLWNYEFERDENGNLYNTVTFHCHRCDGKFYSKTLVGNISNEKMLKCLDNANYEKEIEYSIGCRATGYYENKMRVPVSIPYDEIQELVRDAMDVSSDVDIFDYNPKKDRLY